MIIITSRHEDPNSSTYLCKPRTCIVKMVESSGYVVRKVRV